MIMHTQGLDNCHKRPILPRVSPDPVIGGEITERTEKRRRRSQNHGAQSTVELIFVTNITNYICGQKIVMWRNFGKFGEVLGGFWKF